jgi:hypothetical protein
MSIILSSGGPDRARINEHANHYNTDAVPPALTHVIHMATEDNIIDICGYSAKHTALRRHIKDWLPRNQDNVS